jgi:hypothetical protein
MFSLYKKPIIFEQIMSHELCDTIKKTVKLDNSTVLQHDTYKKILHNDIRKSRSGCIHDTNLNNILLDMCRELLKCEKFIIEQPHVVHYETGGFYKSHHDSDEHVRRDFTFIIALNDGYEGGETHFPLLDQSFKLKKGDVLFFHNRNTDGALAKLSLHEGKTVKSGEKWICNVWVKKLL